MSEILDICQKIRGSVVPYIVIDGKEEVFPSQHNMILKSGADAMVHLLAGDTRYSPCAIIFCGNANNTSVGDVVYNDSYSDLTEGLVARSASILTRQIFEDGGDIGVTFTTTTSSTAGYPNDSLDGKYVKRAILCCKPGTEWVPFSAVNISPSIQLPANANFGIHWSISFPQP